MEFFRRMTGKRVEGKSQKRYDKRRQRPVLRCSICTGEQVAGFQDIHTGSFEEVMLIKGAADLELFRSQYGITEEIAKIY